MTPTPPTAWLTLADLAAELRLESEDAAWTVVRAVNPWTLRQFRKRADFRVRRADWDRAVSQAVEPIRTERERERQTVPSGEPGGPVRELGRW